MLDACAGIPVSFFLLPAPRLPYLDRTSPVRAEGSFLSPSLLSLEIVITVMYRDVSSGPVTDKLGGSPSADQRWVLWFSGSLVLCSAHVPGPQRGGEGRDNGDPWSASPLRCFLWLLVHDALQESTKMRVCCGIIAALLLLVNLKAVAAQGEFRTSAAPGASRADLGSAEAQSPVRKTFYPHLCAQRAASNFFKT